MSFAEKLKEARKKAGFTQVKLASLLNVSQAAIAGWESGNRTPDVDIIANISMILGVSSDYLLGVNREVSNISAVMDDSFRMIPVFESVSAGFGALADDHIVDFMPFRIVSDIEAHETIAIRVKGDSMYPKIEDGDIIQVHKQDTVDNGDIAVILIDGDEGVVKRVLFGKNWVELQSINPNYPPRRFVGRDMERLRIVGLVKGVFREF